MEKNSIFKKLLIIQQTVVGLGKDGAGFNYKYVSGSKVLSVVKPLMNELGLLLKQEVLSIENSRQDYVTSKGVAKSEILSKVMMRFTWVDCETGETDENLFGANGQNDFDKGCGSAYTYAERYFLLKYFHIATDEDDIDGLDKETPNHKDKAPLGNVQGMSKTNPIPTQQDVEEIKKQLMLLNEKKEVVSFYNKLTNEYKANKEIMDVFKIRRDAIEASHQNEANEFSC